MDNMLKDMFMLGIEGDTYKKLLDIAKRKGKSVTEVTSEALQDTIEKNSQVIESKEKRFLMKG